MTYFSSRQSFINHCSQVLLKRLFENFQKKVLFNTSVFHPAKCNSNHKGCDLVIPSSIITHLSRSCVKAKTLEEFSEILEESLTWLVQESKLWKVSIAEWKKLVGGYGIHLDRRKLFRVVLRDLTEYPEGGTTSTTTSPLHEDFMILCHVNNVPTLDDIRTLCYCSVMVAQLKSSLFISVENTTDVSEYNDLIRELDLRLNVVNGTVSKSMPSNEKMEKCGKEFSHLVTKHSPSYFHELVREESNPSYPLLRKIATTSRFKTATESKILCEQKNMSCNMARNAMKIHKSHGSSSPCIHVCSQRKLLLAQQSELYYVWSKELVYQHFQFKKAEENAATENGYDKYLVHSSLSDSDATAACFLKLRHKQITESFESKCQVKAQGEQWKDIIAKMKASLIKLEFLRAAVTTHLTTSWENDTLPSDATFILYNYSRLSTLTKNFHSEVGKGVYTPLPLIEDLDFSVLREESEWNLLIHHLWSFQDVIHKPAVQLVDTTVEMNCHGLISYLQNLCRSTSAFYSRHHILGENLPHLLPVMHCRLYLIKAILVAMEKVFSALGIVPLEQM